VSSATLPFDTASYLAANGYKVGALCGYPKEYSTEKNVPIQECKDDVQIRRMKYIQLPRTSKLGRLVNYFSFTLKAWLNAGKLKHSRSVIVYSNPPVLPIVALRAKKKYGTKLVFVVYDVYPEIAYGSETIAPGSFLDKLMHRINEKLYRQADAVVALTDEMRQYLLDNRKDLTPDRVYTIENWAHEKKGEPLEEGTYEKFGFTKGQFIVGYFGNLGTCQDVQTILDTALALKDDPSVGFLIVGHGNKKDAVKAFIQEHDLQNLKVFDYLTGSDFSQAVALTNCSVVSLQPGLRGTCAPSKYYSCLLGGHPVVAVVEKDSYLAKELVEESVGYHVENGDAEAFVAAVRQMQADPEALAAMGRRATELYKQRYDYPVAMKKYESLFKNIL
jgi:glycosyltransferase involved in cell wall biosynthesis